MRTVVRGLVGPLSGVVEGICTQSLTQCSCPLGLPATQQQQQQQEQQQLLQNSWSYSSLQQHPLQFQQLRQKHTVRMVLLQDHRHLGKKGDLVEVKAGHARNTLFPNGQADYAIPSVIKQLKEQGFLSQQALLQLQPGPKQVAAADTLDPSTLSPQQQLQQIVELLKARPLVVSRRFSLRAPDQPMVGVVTANLLRLYAAKQLHIDLPRELILMDDDSPISQFGSYKVPVNLRDAGGHQVELSVLVRKTYNTPGIRRIKLWAQQQGLMTKTTRQHRDQQGAEQHGQKEQERASETVQQQQPAA